MGRQGSNHSEGIQPPVFVKVLCFSSTAFQFNGSFSNLPSAVSLNSKLLVLYQHGAKF